MTALLTVLKNWKAVVLVAAMVAATAVIGGLTLKLDRALADEAQYKANFQTIQNQAETVNADNERLVAQLKAQNDSITQVAQDALAMQANAKLALAAAQAKHAADAGTISKLQARAAKNEGSCEDEIAILRAGI